MLGSTERRLLIVFILATALVLGAISTITFINSRYETNKVAKQQNRDYAAVSLRLLKIELDELVTMVEDYARWDDTYQYVFSPNSEFTDENFSIDALSALDISGVSILDNNMVTLHRVGNLSGVSNDHIEQHLELLQTSTKHLTARGVLFYNRQIFLLASAMIEDSFESQPANGRLIMFKRVDMEMTESVAITLNQSFSLQSSAAESQYLALSDTESWKLINTDISLQESHVEGVYSLERPNGERVPIAIKLTSSFSIGSYQDFFVTLSPYIVALLILPTVMITLLRRRITKPTRELIKWLNQVDGSQLAEELKPFKHADKGEIGELSEQFSCIYNNLYQQHQFSQILLYSISDFIFTVDHYGNIDYCNPAATEWLKISANQLYGQSFEFLISNLSEDTPAPANWLYRAIHSASEYSGISLIRKFGTETDSEWMEIQVSPMIKSDDEPMGALVILRPKPDYAAS